MARSKPSQFLRMHHSRKYSVIPFLRVTVCWQILHKDHVCVTIDFMPGSSKKIFSKKKGH